MKEPQVFEAHERHVTDLTFTAAGDLLISAGMDNLVRLWSVPDWSLSGTFEGHTHSVNSLSLSPDGRTLATGSTDTTVRLWAFPGGEPLYTLQDRRKVVSAVQISADGRWVAAGSYGGRAKVWTLAGEDVVGIKAGKKNLASIALSPDGSTLATAGLGDEISLWALPSGGLVGALSGHEIAVLSLAFVDGGERLVSLGYEKTVRAWATGTWEERIVLPLNGPTVRGMAMAPSEDTVAVAAEGEVQLWSLASGELRERVAIGVKGVGGMAFSSDGKRLAVGGADGRIRVFGLEAALGTVGRADA
ncbi:MAG: WD40 repeat domain-containing protein [Anaerolineae bacterium]